MKARLLVWYLSLIEKWWGSEPCLDESAFIRCLSSWRSALPGFCLTPVLCQAHGRRAELMLCLCIQWPAVLILVDDFIHTCWVRNPFSSLVNVILP